MRWAWSRAVICYKNETHFPPTDPEARLYRKGNHREAQPSYLAHDLIDTKSRVILRRKASLATGIAERDTALEMLDEVLESKDEWGLPSRPEILTADANYGASGFIADLFDRDIEAHVPLLAGDARRRSCRPLDLIYTFDSGQSGFELPPL